MHKIMSCALIRYVPPLVKVGFFTQEQDKKKTFFRKGLTHLDRKPNVAYFNITMNWDWDKLQEKRQRQSRQSPFGGDNNNNDNGDNGGDDNRKPPINFGKMPENPLRGRMQMPSGKGIWFMGGALVVLWLLSGIFIVEPDEEGVVLRFGKYVRTVGPGPHYHLPVPIEAVYKPKVTQVLRGEVGFRSVGQGLTFQQGQLRTVPEEASMLTGDENIVNVQFSVQYKISNPVEYLFNVTNQAAVVRNAAEAAMREVIGKSMIDSALTDGKIRIQSDATELLQNILNRYEVGVQIIAVQLQDVHPPQEVIDAFKDVASAREDKSRIINEAEAYRNEILPKARGEAAQLENQAQAYKETRVQNATGVANRFLAVLTEYNKAQDITKKRLYYEAMEDILTNANDKIIVPSGTADRTLPFLPLTAPTGQKSVTPKNAGGNQ